MKYPLALAVIAAIGIWYAGWGQQSPPSSLDNDDEDPVAVQYIDDWCRDWAHSQTTFSELYETYWKNCMYWRSQGMTIGGR